MHQMCWTVEWICKTVYIFHDSVIPNPDQAPSPIYLFLSLDLYIHPIKDSMIPTKILKKFFFNARDPMANWPAILVYFNKYLNYPFKHTDIYICVCVRVCVCVCVKEKVKNELTI